MFMVYFGVGLGNTRTFLFFFLPFLLVIVDKSFHVP